MRDIVLSVASRFISSRQVSGKSAGIDGHGIFVGRHFRVALMRPMFPTRALDEYFTMRLSAYRLLLVGFASLLVLPSAISASPI